MAGVCRLDGGEGDAQGGAGAGPVAGGGFYECCELLGAGARVGRRRLRAGVRKRQQRLLVVVLGADGAPGSVALELVVGRLVGR